ncbi:MAG: FeoA family protein [Chloroflexota bacterium]
MSDTFAPRASLPLTLVAPGETVELVEIRLSGDEKQRLQELGLLPGTSIRVVKSDPLGGLIIAVRHDGRLALNRSTAHKLIVCMER